MIMATACGGTNASSAPPTSGTTPTPGIASSKPSPTPTCSPSGTKLEISAQADTSKKLSSPYAFDKECLAAPAGTPFTIRFDNRDHESHNLDILDHPGGTSLFVGKVINGPKVIMYAVDPLPAGKHYFRCDIHPLRMNGTFVVGA